jgi:diaminohydroxyphosphoribosylaminopyrimidine deaminase/5-amino-6-(5-phosphoribosylamino)uracil reductase
MADPDPRVSGGGVSALEKAGVEVIPGVLEDECRWLNRGFVKRVTSGRPWVTVKAAISIDGNMAMADGQSKWITCAESRRRAHIARAENDAVMVGIGTILNDDPQLDVRDSDGHSPMKAVVDRDLRIPPRALALKGGNCAVFTGRPADGAKASELRSSGAKIIEMDTDGGGHIPPGLMLRELAAMGVNRLMVEGGAGIAGSFIKSGLVDEYSVFIAPKLMGSGIKMSERLSFSLMEDAIPLKKFSARDVGGDIWFRGAPSCSRG